MILRRYAVGKDFTEADYHKWLDQLIWWIGDNFTKVKNPREHAETVLKAAMNGTKLDGTEWRGGVLPDSFFARVTGLCGFDLLRGVGVRAPGRGRRKAITKDSGELTTLLPPIDLRKAMEMRTAYIQDLLNKYPHLDNPVYKPKVDELAETVIKSRMMSNDFIMSRGKELELISKIRESLHKQIGELMRFLEIAPEQRIRKTLETKNTDVGSLVARLESYGETWEEFERIDALRELIQLYKMLKSKRPDGTPQLNNWELYHLTRSKAIHFKCRCGEEWDLIAGFTPEEIEAALVQAGEVYGFGLTPIGTSSTAVVISEEIADPGFVADETLSTDDATINVED